MDLELFIIKMVECTKEIGNIIRWLAKESYSINQENWLMKADGPMISSKAREHCITSIQSYFINP
jgi:hypothetical protein